MLNSNNLGARIATARKRANMSQTDIADAVSISPQMVSKWERGDSLPDVIMLTRLAEILKTDINYFIYGTEGEKTSFENAELDAEKAESGAAGNLSQEDKRNAKKADKRKRLFKMGAWKEMDFAGTDLRGNKFDFAGLVKCDFSGCVLQNATFKFCNVTECDFDKADLENSDFSMSEIGRCSFKNARLNGCNMDGADLDECDFKEADLSDVQAKRICIRNSVIDSVIIKNALFEECLTRSVEFKNITFNNVIFKHCNLKNTTFENCAMDKITYNFLKACKADLDGVSVM